MWSLSIEENAQRGFRIPARSSTANTQGAAAFFAAHPLRASRILGFLPSGRRPVLLPPSCGDVRAIRGRTLSLPLCFLTYGLRQAKIVCWHIARI